jgi:hypothetical protein
VRRTRVERSSSGVASTGPSASAAPKSRPRGTVRRIRIDAVRRSSPRGRPDVCAGIRNGLVPERGK